MLERNLSEMCAALGAPGPAHALIEKSDLYRSLIGSWDVEVFDFEERGSKRVSSGEWHFAWALEGRAVQDVFIAPRRGERSPTISTKGNRYGTSLHVYDPAQDVWRVHWFNPVQQAHDTMTARRMGDQIVQMGTDSDGPFRWTFSGIDENSFRWRAEKSYDGGKSWKPVTEIHARRYANDESGPLDS